MATVQAAMNFIWTLAIMPHSQILRHESHSLGCKAWRRSDRRPLSRQVERLYRLAVAHVESRAHQRRWRPGDAFEHRCSRQHLELLGAHFAKCERSILIGEYDLAVGVEQLRLGETAFSPLD